MGNAEQRTYQFSFGVWNLATGADPFGPPVRPELPFARKLQLCKEMGFDALQFHDDDIAPADAPLRQLQKTCRELKKILDGEGVATEFVAPRLWEHPATVDGGPTANNPKTRRYALDRGRRTVDIARMMGTRRVVYWPAREGTLIREAKDPARAYGWLLDFINGLLEHDPEIRLLGEMKPNEPMDLMYCPTSAHFLALGQRSIAPERVGVLIESAHCILLGLDPSEEMAFAQFCGKLWGVHLNDQDGLKFDQDKTFGSVNLRRAFNQVWVLERGGYGQGGEMIGFDVKPMRTQPAETAHLHLRNCKEIFLRLVELARSLDVATIDSLRGAGNYEELDRAILRHLMGSPAD